MFLTDVLLFTHLLHLPKGQMRQKPLMLLDRSIVIVRRTFKDYWWQ